ncbi:hypothetical protein [Paenibacillus oralis]|nr:hypothetical protein [Paenibacillus oralis]
MTRDQHIAASKWARWQALRNQKIHGNLLLKSGSKSLTSAFNEAISNAR